MNNDMFSMYLKNVVSKALSSGGTTMLEELAESLSDDSLGKLIDILSKIRDKRKNTVETKGG
jgi:hypothetical protein